MFMLSRNCAVNLTFAYRSNVVTASVAKASQEASALAEAAVSAKDAVKKLATLSIDRVVANVANAHGVDDQQDKKLLDENEETKPNSKE